MNNNTTAGQFCFTEEMNGFLAPGQSSFEAGAHQGRELNQSMSVHLTIRMDDLDAFLDAPSHEAQAIGYLDGTWLGGRCPVLKGRFNLFLHSGDGNRKTMNYRLFFEDRSGQALTLSGVKQVQNNLGPDLWHDTTTLLTNLFAGHVGAEDESSAVVQACGILHISLAGFLKQLTTFRSNAPTQSERLAALERFGRFFMGEVWTIYRPQMHPRASQPVREIPLHTLDGVQGAEVSTHYATTGDGLGISLLRFLRGRCDDVVLLVPGLTASSDMFIMPEHQNLTQTLLDQGFTDVWTLDGRISNRHPYNLSRHRYNVDDVALFDNPAAIDVIRKAIGPQARLHIISHCLGALSVAMSLMGRKIDGIRSVICNGVALTPKVNRPAKLKLLAGPFLSETVLGLDYLNPAWSRAPGLSPGKLLAKAVSAFHHECDVPECHMTSFMWGFGNPVLFKHEQLHDITHRRTGDLFGGSGVNYYRHILKMVQADNSAVKYLPDDARYASLPNHYFEHAAAITTPMLLVTGQDNALFFDANVLCHQRLQQLAPGRHQLRVFPGYGHADVMMGKNAAVDVFPTLIAFLKQNSGPATQPL